MTAAELIVIARVEHPTVVYRASVDGDRIAIWYAGRWVAIAGRTLDGEWFNLPSPELLIDGRPAFDSASYGAPPEGGMYP